MLLDVPQFNVAVCSSANYRVLPRCPNIVNSSLNLAFALVGLVRSTIGDPTPERGGRRKKYHWLEADGSRALADSYRAWREMISDLESILEAL